MIASIKEAQTPAELDAIRAGVDGAVERLAERAARGEFDEQRTGVLSRHQLHRSPYRRAARSAAERPGRELFRCSPGAACSALMRPTRLKPGVRRFSSRPLCCSEEVEFFRFSRFCPLFEHFY